MAAENFTQIYYCSFKFHHSGQPNHGIFYSILHTGIISTLPPSNAQMSDTMKNDQLKNVVKYVVEYAYHQFKREFGDDDHSKELTRRYKVRVLLI